jgi:hypothetical protein
MQQKFFQTCLYIEALGQGQLGMEKACVFSVCYQGHPGLKTLAESRASQISAKVTIT